jgi:predicted RND superfamily exporter protein
VVKRMNRSERPEEARPGRRWLPWAVGLAVVGIVATGLWRLRVDMDVFTLLPSDSRVAKGLQLYQGSFASSRELIVTLRSPDADLTKRAARSLAGALKDAGLTSQALWQSPLRGDPAQQAELLAYLWFNQPPKEFDRLAGRFQGGRVESRLESDMERIGTSFNPQEVALLTNDPFGLTDVANRVPALSSNRSSNGFSSDGGRFRILFVSPPREDAGVWAERRWVKKVIAFVDAWKKEGGFDDTLSARVTGTPAFMYEAGSGLLRDVVYTAVGTLILVAGVFWLAHRTWLPLAWLVALLVFVLALSVSLGGLLLGRLSAASLGFAAILLGLAADYGLLLYQEFSIHPGRTIEEHRSEVAPGILWSALTTAAAFFMITRSSLPGLVQLGALVGIGVLVAAGVMLWAYLPPLIKRVRPRGGAGTEYRGMAAPLRIAWAVTFLAVGASSFALVRKLPEVDYSTRDLGPKFGKAREALREIETEMGGFSEGLWMIIGGRNVREVSKRMSTAGQLLEEAKGQGVLAAYSLPEGLLPRSDAQQANRETAKRLAGRLPAVRKAALAEGFTEASLKLTDQVFADWKSFVQTKGIVWPKQVGARWVLGQFVGSHAGETLALGRLEASKTATQDDLLALARKIGSTVDGYVFSWSLLSESLLGLVQHDVKWVLLPTLAVLVLFLGLAFRTFPEVALSLATLGFSLLCLFALMVVLGWQWNLMNVMAVPLLLGAGVDYGIHMQLALRRHRGVLSNVQQTVGRAILLCSVSSASGFGTLAFASNAGLSSLGRVCAVGILITSLVSVFLLPVWWRSIRGNPDAGPPKETI